MFLFIDCVHLANKIIISCGMTIPRLTFIQDINSMFFAQLFKQLFKVNIIFDVNSKVDQIRLIDSLITALSNRLLGVPLDHINCKKILAFDSKSIFDLLEIIYALVKHLPSKQISTSTDYQIHINSSNKQVQTEFDSDLEDAIDDKSTSPVTNSETLAHQHSQDFQAKTDDDLSKFKQLQTENFAMQLGMKLHEILKLKQMTRQIETNIKQFYHDDHFGKKNMKSPKTKCQKSKKMTKRVKFEQKKQMNLRRMMPNTRDLDLDELLLRFPDIHKGAAKALKQQEINQQKVIANLNKQVITNETKMEMMMKDAIEKQEKKSQMIHQDVRRLQRLTETKQEKTERIRQNAEIRDNRLERARLEKIINNYYTETISKLKELQSKEEILVKKEFEKRFNEKKDDIMEFRKRIKELHNKEKEKQRQLLEKFENL